MTDAVEVELTLRPCLVCGGPAVRFKTYAQRDTRPTLTGHVSTGEYDDYHTSCAARSGLKCRGAMLKTTAHTRAEADEKWNALHATQDTLRADNARLQRELEEVRAAVREARLRAASRNSLVQPGHLYKLDDTEAPDV